MQYGHKRKKTIFSSALLKENKNLKAFLSELFDPAMGHFAQSVGVAARMVCKHTPLHLAARAVRT